MATWKVSRERRVFCFDVEARPGPWGGGDFTYKSMLSIAGAYEDDEGNPFYLGPGFKPRQLERFVRPFREGALIVTHNGPRYDLPFLNGTCLKLGLEPLPPLTIHDTYAHLLKRGLAFSASLGNLARRFDVGVEKGSMGEVDWDRAYHGDRDALARLKDYNVGDVMTTLALRRKLMDLGLLRAPARWVP